MLLVRRDAISVKYSLMSPVVILLSRRKQCFPANKNPFIIFYLSLKLTNPKWHHNFIIFQQSLSPNSNIRSRKISSSRREEFYAHFLCAYPCEGCSTTVLCLAFFSTLLFSRQQEQLLLVLKRICLFKSIDQVHSSHFCVKKICHSQ